MKLLTNLTFVAATLVASTSEIPAQFSWWFSGAPLFGRTSYCYEPVRDRMIMFWSNGTTQWTFEYDDSFGPVSGWAGFRSAPVRDSRGGGVAFDPTRERIILYDGWNFPPELARTWSWDGATWTEERRGDTNHFDHVMTHSGRSSVIAMGGNAVSGSDLFEWDGTSWNLLPQTVQPPRAPRSSLFWSYYLSGTYDARRDKIVIFGYADFDRLQVRYVNGAPTIWEWDAVNGWVNNTVAFPIPFPDTCPAQVHTVFDAHRGTIVAFMTTLENSVLTVRSFEWDGGSTWRELATPTLPPPVNHLVESLEFGHDSLRGRSYATLRLGDMNQQRPVFATSDMPAEFETHGTGCAGTLGQSQLRLVHPWTRAWLGGALEVEATNLPLDSAFMVYGCSDTMSGTTLLPAPLDSYGMPGCSARASLDAVQLIVGTNNSASSSLQIPVDTSLVGRELFQQAFVPDPAANSLGMTVTNSVRFTVGAL